MNDTKPTAKKAKSKAKKPLIAPETLSALVAAAAERGITVDALVRKCCRHAVKFGD